MMEPARVSKLRQEAKAMAKSRRRREGKQRLIERWLTDQHKHTNTTTTTTNDTETNDSVDPHSTKGAIVNGHGRNKHSWDQPISINGRIMPGSTTHGAMMLRAAENCYKYAATDFDGMDLYDHMLYIQKALQPPESQVPLHQMLVTRELIVMAQHQLYLAQTDFVACVAKLAILEAMPKSLREGTKTCKDCFEKFRPQSAPCSCAKAGKACLHGPCRYHPGKLRSWNDECVEGSGGLQGSFLDSGRVTMHEFKIWIHQCYWDCCGGKLLRPGTPRRSQRKKSASLEPWEIRKNEDGRIGCQTRAQHVAMV